MNEGTVLCLCQVAAALACPQIGVAMVTRVLRRGGGVVFQRWGRDDGFEETEKITFLNYTLHRHTLTFVCVCWCIKQGLLVSMFACHYDQFKASKFLLLSTSPQVFSILCCAPSWVTPPRPSSPPFDFTSSVMSSQATPTQGSRPLTPPLISAGSPRSPLSPGKGIFLSTLRLLRKRTLHTDFAHEDQFIPEPVKLLYNIVCGSGVLENTIRLRIDF